MLQHLSTAVVVLNRNLAVETMNPAAETLFATSERAVTGQPLAGLLPGISELSGRFSTALADDLSWTARELPLALAGGLHQVTVDLSVSSLDGDRLLLEFTGVDRHLRISRDEQLSAQYAASRALIRGLAHEIKNPLGGLRGAAQLLDRRLDDASLKQFTRVIIAEADRLGTLVDDLLGPARPPERQPTNIHEVTERVATLVEAELAGAAELHRDYDPSLPELEVDGDQLVQALLNIVRNALQAGAGVVTLRTRVERRVTIGRALHRLVLCIDIEDDGPGIPLELQEQVFFPLFTTRDDGSGLGLAIAQSLVAAHDGLIECRSAPGHTVFTLMLPMEQSHE
jgi:two-component system, NtrC family, nitrogen regulation sensor histidine kinase GlnL